MKISKTLAVPLVSCWAPAAQGRSANAAICDRTIMYRYIDPEVYLLLTRVDVLHTLSTAVLPAAYIGQTWNARGQS